jgi:hypothetical protein
VVGQRLLLKLSIHRAKLLPELVSDGRGGAWVCLEQTGLGSRMALVGLAHAWELLS